MNRMTAYEEFSRKNELAIKASKGEYTDLNEIIKSYTYISVYEVFFKRFDSDKGPD